MNKNLILGVVVLLLLAGGAYAIRSKNSSAPKTQTERQAVSEGAEFARAIESGKPTLCTMTKGDDKMEYLIKGKKMVANITTKIEDKITLSHMINDEKYLYMWSDGVKQGTKFNLLVPSPSPLSSAPTNPTTPKFDSANDYDQLKNEGYTINCKAGSISDSAFLPPSDVTFIDPSEVMKQLTPQGDNGQFDVSKLQELQQQYGGSNQEDQ